MKNNASPNKSPDLVLELSGVHFSILRAFPKYKSVLSKTGLNQVFKKNIHMLAWKRVRPMKEKNYTLNQFSYIFTGSMVKKYSNTGI